jgi:radical SAM protein with 4Fe4S-binding SPASM domain
MFFRQRFNTFIRVYGDIAYIKNIDTFTDRVVDSSGAVFVRALSRKAKTLNEISAEIARSFFDVEINILENDILEFYGKLEADGFIISGETEAELDRKDTRFSYAADNPKTARFDFTPEIQRANEESGRFLENHFEDNPPLTGLQFELTSRCNERCIHCYIPHQDKTTDINGELFFNIVDQFSEMGGLHITLSGGEPMAHPRFAEFLRVLKTRDFSLEIFSNLTLLTEDILAGLRDSHLVNLQVSLYSMKPETHDAITAVPGSFEKTVDSILRLKANDVPVVISCPALKRNSNDYTAVLQWAYENKIQASADYLLFARYDRITDNLDNRLGVNEVGALVKDKITYDKRFQTTFLNRLSAEKNDAGASRVCTVCQSLLVIGADGIAYPCPAWRSRVVGDLNKQSLREIWTGSPDIMYLRSLRLRDLPECLACADREFCQICLNRNANENPEGNPLKINKHFCKVAALNRKIIEDWKAKNAGEKREA